MKPSEDKPGEMADVVLQLFVTGSSQRSARAIEAVQFICNHRLQPRVALEIIDVLEQPQQAENERILATPTLIRQSPGPPRRLIGELADVDRVIQLLGLNDQVRTKGKE